MLRASLRRSQPLIATASRSRVAAQWSPAQQLQPSFAAASQRWFADNKKADETVFPGSESKKAPSDVPSPPPLSPASGSSLASNINAQEIPKPPPASAAPVKESKTAVPAAPTPPTGTGTATVAPPPGSAAPPPPPPKRRRRLLRFLIYLTLLSGLGYAGGVYYSLVSDNFHDFFTEYVPFGEDAVAYFEEREFRKRFPGITPADSRLHPQIRGEEKVKIPSKSGISSRTVEKERTSDLASSGKHMSAIDDGKSKPAQKSTPKTAETAAAEQKTEKPSDSHTHDLLPKEATPVKSDASSDKANAPPAVPKPDSSKATPKAEQPKAPAPAAPLIDNITISGASEPVVQDIVKILNDIITVVNADNAAGKYSSAIGKAKEDLGKVVSDINTLKALEQKSAEDKIRAAHLEFDGAAKELVTRLEREMREQETHFKEEYETEREKLAQSYQDKLKSELEVAQQVYDQKLKNQLLEQAIALQRQFTDSLHDRVEKERSGRLSKLTQLSDSVHDLEKLTGEWNSVVDANLKTQHLIVAVEAVRATLENADRPQPFVEELAALKEVASDDPVVNAAIASINPTAYQRGIPTTSQLIDRFRRVASEVRKASLLPENAGVASHLASVVLSKVMFKKQGLPLGDDVESVLTRTEVLLEEGDIDGAAREMNGLNGWAKLLARDWLSDCRKILEVKQALDVITTEARLQSLLVD